MQAIVLERGNIFWPNWAHIKSWKTSSERAFWERFRGRGRGRVKSGVGVRVRKTLKKPVGWGWKWPSLKDGLGFSSKRKEIVLFPFFWKIFSLGLTMLKSIILPTKWSLLLSVSPKEEEKAQIFVCFSLYCIPTICGTWVEFWPSVSICWVSEWMNEAAEWMNKEQEWRHACMHFQREEEVLLHHSTSGSWQTRGFHGATIPQLSQAPIQAHTHINHHFHLNHSLVDSTFLQPQGLSHLPFHRKAVNHSHWEEAVLVNTCIVVYK